MKPKITIEIAKEKVKEVHTIPDVIVEIFDYDSHKYYDSVLEEDANKRLCRRTRYLRGGTRHDEEPIKIAILNGRVAKVVMPQKLGVIVEVRYLETGKTEEFQ